MTTVNKEYSDSGLGTQEEPKVTVVGMEFIAGPEGDDMIVQALGFHPARVGSVGYTMGRGGDIADLTPGYCTDAARCIDMLDQLGAVPFILPTEKPKGVRKFEPGFVAVFEIHGEIHVTVPQPTEDAAAACALWFVLGVSHD